MALNRTYTDSDVRTSIWMYAALFFLAVVTGLLIASITPTSIVVAVVLGLGLLFIFSPFKGLLAYLLVFPILDQLTSFTLFEFGALEINSQIFLRGTLLLVIALYWITRKHRFFDYPLTKPISLFLSYFFISSAIGLDPITGLTYWAKLAFWLLLIPTSTAILLDAQRENPDSEELLGGFARFSLLVIIVSVVFSVLNGVTTSGSAYGVGEVFGQFSSQHALALPLTMGLTWAIMPLVSGRRVIFPTLLAGAILVVILGTYVRTSLVAVLIGILVLLIFALRLKFIDSMQKKLACFLAILLVCTVTIGHLYINKDSWSQRTQDFSTTETAGAGRLDIYGDNLNYFLSSSIFQKVFGNGLHSTSAISKENTGSATEGHNDFVELLVGGGILGLFLYFMLLFLTWREIQKRLVDRSIFGLAAVMGFAILLASGLLNGIIFYPSALTYFAVLIGAMISADKQTPVNDESPIMQSSR